ncbi:MAG: hypothetical protein JF595_12655 [Sphingomonadales bacterium]|nr:hypothetical protein [Sphingomonadales bacterium]
MPRKRDNDNALITEAEELPVPSQQGSSGGEMARQVGQRDEEKTATGADQQVTKVEKADKRDKGDMPTPPQTRK